MIKQKKGVLYEKNETDNRYFIIPYAAHRSVLARQGSCGRYSDNFRILLHVKCGRSGNGNRLGSRPRRRESNCETGV